MIRNKTVFEVKIGEKLYQFQCEPDSPLVEVNDVLNIMKNHISKMIQDHMESQKPKEAEEQVVSVDEKQA
jgi:hypothetical protein